MKALIFIPLIALGCMLASCQEKRTTPEPRVVAPIELEHEVIFVTESIGNSGPLQMALDTGSHTTLDEEIARKLGLDLSMKALSSGIKGRQQISVLKDLPLKFCGMQISEPIVMSYP